MTSRQTADTDAPARSTISEANYKQVVGSDEARFGTGPAAGGFSPTMKPPKPSVTFENVGNTQEMTSTRKTSASLPTGAPASGVKENSESPSQLTTNLAHKTRKTSTSAPPTETAQGIITDPNTKLSSTMAHATSEPWPEDLPRALLPADPQDSDKIDRALIRIGFLRPLNYVFLAQNTSAASQVMTLLPHILPEAHESDSDPVRVLDLVPYDTRVHLGYVTTLARLYYPDQLLDQLHKSMLDPEWSLRARGNKTLSDLTNLIDTEIGIR